MGSKHHGPFSIRKNKPLPRKRLGLSTCEIVAEEQLPDSEDILIRARCLQYECFVIWDTVRGILRSPWSHDDDRCEVMGWDREPETIVAVGNWTTSDRTLWSRKAEAIRAYGGTPNPASHYNASEESSEETSEEEE